jgi:hypothetical protein
MSSSLRECTMKIVLTQKQIVKIVSEHVARHRGAFSLPENYLTEFVHVRTDKFGSGDDVESEVVITIHTKEKP